MSYFEIGIGVLNAIDRVSDLAERVGADLTPKFSLILGSKTIAQNFLKESQIAGTNIKQTRKTKQLICFLNKSKCEADFESSSFYTTPVSDILYTMWIVVIHGNNWGVI